MPKDQANNREKDRDLRGGFTSSHFDIKAQDIVKAFLEKKESEYQSYFQIRSKDSIANDFKDYMREKYDDGILQELAQSGQLDVEFNQIANKGFTVADFLSEKKGNLVKEQFIGISSEKDALSHMTMDCYTRWNKLPNQEKDKLPFEDFLREIEFKIDKNQDGLVTSIKPLPKSKANSVVQLKNLWDRFVRSHSTDSKIQEYNSDLMMTDRFDPSEKIACIAATQGIYTKILKIGGNKSQQLLSIREDVFESDINQKPVSAFNKRITLSGLELCLKDFFSIAIQKNLLTKDEIHNLQNITINPRICVNLGKSFGELSNREYDTQKFSQLDHKIQKISERLVTTDMVTNIEKDIDQIDTSIENFARTFEMPGTMKHFFDQFPLDDIKNHIPQQKRKEYSVLKAKDESLRNQAEQAHRDGNESELKKIENEILENTKVMKSFIDKDMKPSRDEYILSICDATQENLKHLSIQKNENFTEELSTTLRTLQMNRRDAGSLTLSQQNILMKASIAAQLRKVQQSDMISTLGYDFAQYSQFMLGLFDLTSTTSVITTKDHSPIEIIFSKKKLVGKPYDWQTISLEDMQDLSQLRMEFEIDLKDDVDGVIESFLKTITGGPKSQVIKNFFGMTHPASGMPKTITDSTFVELTGKDGKRYEGYLSPAYLANQKENIDGSHQTDDYGSGTTDMKKADTYANTFVLYTTPVDQLNDERRVVTREKEGTLKEGELYTPITINADNLADRNMKVIHKKATLSDKTINALALGHMIAQNHTTDDLLNGKLDTTMKDLEAKINDYATHDGTELETTKSRDDHDDHHKQESSEAVPSQKLLKGWDNLFPDNNKDKIELKEGQRFAFWPNQNNYALGTPSIPDYRQMLSGTVTNIKKDNGIITSFDFEVDNLTIGGTSLSKRIRSITSDNISSFSHESGNIFQKIIYLGSEQKNNPSQYTELVGYLSNGSMFGGKGNPDFMRTSLDGISMKSDGTFSKNDKDVYKFIATDATKSEDSDSKTNYHIEYDVKKKGDKYHITSTGYTISDPDDKDGKKKKTTSFDLTTDLTGLLLVLANKKLTPYSKDEYNVLTQQEGHSGPIPTKRPNKFRSIGTVVHVFKDGMFKKMVDAWKHKREESGKQELEYRIFQEYNIYRRLEHRFGPLLEKFDMNFLEHLADEEEPKAMEYGWKKIEHELQFLEKFHHSYNIGMLKTGDSQHKGANAICEEYLEHAVDNMKHGGNCTYKQRYKVAAALMYMLKTYKFGYARLLRRFPKGTYIRILLGEHAYARFLIRYKEREKQLENSKTGNQVQEQLMTMEYNFIVNNISGGPNQDEAVRDLDFDGNQGGGNAAKNDNARYYQRLYSRKFGNELRTIVGGVKKISPAVNDEEVQKGIGTGSFVHMKNEFYSHIAQLRVDVAVAELVAMQQLATTTEQADEVIVAIMTGLLNGAFIHYLGNKTRDDFRRVCRNSGIPFANRMEHHDAPQKIQRLLCLATIGLDDKNQNKRFSNFKYQRKDLKGKPVAEPEPYRQSDFGPMTRREGDLDGLRDAFKKRLDPVDGKAVREKVMNFIHMDNIMKDDDDNMMYIWKNKKAIEAGKLKIKDTLITLDDWNVVDSLLSELYFNKDRGAALEEYNRAYRSGPTGARTRTMIDNVFPMMNRTSGNVFEGGVGDHAETLRLSINKRIPKDDKLPETQKYKMAYYVDEFFRVFRGIGAIDYTKEMIEKFYKHINIIRHHPELSEKDKIRLIRFYLVEQAYEKGSIPPIVEKALTKYLWFFEKNINLFDQEMASMHRHPGAGADDDKNFGEIFAHEHDNEKYYPDKEWRQKTSQQREREFREERDNGVLLINYEMQDANGKLKGTRRGGHHVIGKDVDELIDELRGGMGGSSAHHDHSKKTNTLESHIRATNNDLIKRGDIKSDKEVGGKVIKMLTPEERKKKQEEEDLNRKIDDRFLSLSEAA